MSPLPPHSDFYLGFGVGMMFCGLLFKQIWWILGGFTIFMMPFIAVEFDKHTVHGEGVSSSGKEMQDTLRSSRWQIPDASEERRRDQESLLLKQN